MHLAYFLLYKQRGKYFLEKIKCYLKKKKFQTFCDFGRKRNITIPLYSDQFLSISDGDSRTLFDFLKNVED